MGNRFKICRKLGDCVFSFGRGFLSLRLTKIVNFETDFENEYFMISSCELVTHAGPISCFRLGQTFLVCLTVAENLCGTVYLRFCDRILKQGQIQPDIGIHRQCTQQSSLENEQKEEKFEL